MIKIALLGSTGSIGRQVLSTVARHSDKFKIVSLSANSSYEIFSKQVNEFKPQVACLTDPVSAIKITEIPSETTLYTGENATLHAITEDCDIVFVAISGFAGLAPVLHAIEMGKDVALANKETLVAGGEIVMKAVREKGVRLIPVDSEHSAIFQCLKSGKQQEIKRIMLTASGGPFFGYTKEQLKGITLEDALAHPTWKMGAKITIDSATLMNKGFEVIEAALLFGVSADRIEVVVHRESIIHSMVEYIDNSVIAQMSVPDMRLCVQYAVTYPEREMATIPELDLFKVASLSFKKPDPETFSLLSRAIDCANKGGALPAVLNAANEVAVGAFLDRRIQFYQIAEAVGEVVDAMQSAKDAHELSAILELDLEARRLTANLLKL